MTQVYQPGKLYHLGIIHSGYSRPDPFIFGRVWEGLIDVTLDDYLYSCGSQQWATNNRKIGKRVMIDSLDVIFLVDSTFHHAYDDGTVILKVLDAEHVIFYHMNPNTHRLLPVTKLTTGLRL